MYMFIESRFSSNNQKETEPEVDTKKLSRLEGIINKIKTEKGQGYIFEQLTNFLQSLNVFGVSEKDARNTKLFHILSGSTGYSEDIPLDLNGIFERYIKELAE